MAEQRKHQRVPVTFTVSCRRKDGGTFEGVSRDVSMGGMFIEATEPAAFGNELTLTIAGISARPLQMPAVVRWVEPRGFGVQFGLLGAYATHALVELMKKHSP